jgi:hypothetical protein
MEALHPQHWPRQLQSSYIIQPLRTLEDHEATENELNNYEHYHDHTSTLADAQTLLIARWLLSTTLACFGRS